MGVKNYLNNKFYIIRKPCSSGITFIKCVKVLICRKTFEFGIEIGQWILENLKITIKSVLTCLQKFFLRVLEHRYQELRMQKKFIGFVVFSRFYWLVKITILHHCSTRKNRLQKWTVKFACHTRHDLLAEFSTALSTETKLYRVFVFILNLLKCLKK
jgi:hypothetical protein